MTETQLLEIKQDLENEFRSYDKKVKTSKTLLSGNLLTGKIYEAFVLLYIIKRIVLLEKKFVVLFNNDNTLTLQSGPGDIQRSRPHFRIYASQEQYRKSESSQEFELWTNIEFMTYSFKISKHTSISQGDYHELDIAVLNPNVSGKPSHSDVRIAVECKNTPFKKEHLRQLLGIRRELSVLSKPASTVFSTWPASEVNADPPSVLMAFGTDSKILNYRSPGKIFSIQLHHLAITI
jgi:hypothetical protein